MRDKPLLRDFMGLNGHTVSFRPDLYRPVCRLVRDYHNVSWDLGKDSSSRAPFPMSSNKIDWAQLYGSWKRAGWEIDLCSQFGEPPTYWKDIPNDAYQYGRDLAGFFGPSSHNLITSAEVGNEPGNYSDGTYRMLFENMARGFRAGDPRLKIVTCATFDSKSGKYHKGLSCFQGLESLIDAYNVHSYAQAEGWPTWRRSYPEDPKIPYLKDIQAVIDWRNRNARGREVWLTEFGYDATTKPQDKTGDFKQWVGVTDTQQARYIVRSFLVFAAIDLDRAYLYFFNDEDRAMVHASSGLTRNFQPKPSFFAMAHLYQTLGEYRFSQVVRIVAGDQYVYEFRHGRDASRLIWVLWSPTGSERRTVVVLDGLPGRFERAERMPLTPGTAENVRPVSANGSSLRIEIDESPVYLSLRAA